MSRAICNSGPKVHPRERGEAVRLSIEELNGRGPSPRARGSRAVAPGQLAEPRSIPASAGKPRRRRARRSSRVVHPRERGEAGARIPLAPAAAGPSPRARGSQCRRRAGGGRVGSIPASAGKPRPSRRRRDRSGVHPRERGEASSIQSGRLQVQGPSPRARGSPPGGDRRDRGGGSIPASAGKPPASSLAGCRCRVHPRERGEARLAGTGATAVEGPSPRARGSPCGSDRSTNGKGSIPASAGKPCACPVPAQTGQVHPRERGEAAAVRRRANRLAGPSPRARGSRRRPAPHAPVGGSIPASAGKPARAATTPANVEVHPRERGEAPAVMVSCQPVVGPSPRARGSPGHRPRKQCRLGSIPASAGKPASPSPCARWLQVHPRERGEASGNCPSQPYSSGPSPRARGSRLRRQRGERRAGSIPASAGKPAAGRAGSATCWVHPRERGEARRAGTPSGAPSGPSPRARGSRAAEAAIERRQGSIPASAGKPTRSRQWRSRPGVHPRERGEARQPPLCDGSIGGPSPRARGSLAERPGDQRRLGSIPASAGKPRTASHRSRWGGVHPRERGEAAAARVQLRMPMGPSPRARGSLSVLDPRVSPLRSIPASAGKPLHRRRRARDRGVHPRERGEACSRMASRWPRRGPSPRARGSRVAWVLERTGDGSIPASAGKPRRRIRPA